MTASGVELSPKMVGLARQAYPDLRLTAGTMTALETGDDELGGILAWHSTHHTPRPHGRLLERAGLVVTARLELELELELEPGALANRPPACLLARKPEQP